MQKTIDLKKIILVLTVFFLSGCLHLAAPHAPENWKKNSTIVEPSVLEDDPDKAVLQVLIMSGPIHCAHTALRLYCPGKGPLFWDPAGGYGREEDYPTVERRYDVFVNNLAPTLNDYLKFRVFLPTATTEIFQWSPDAKTVCGYYDTLANEGLTHRDKSFFNTTSKGVHCNLSVSQFLRDHAEGFSGVEKKFFPHDLSDRLYKLKPEKVYIFKKEKIYKLPESEY